MDIEVNTPILTALADPAGGYTDLGARVEVPVTRAIASYWKPGSLDNGVWTVTLDPVVAAGQYLVVWRNSYDPPDVEVFIPLMVTAAAAEPDDMPPVDRNLIKPSVDDVANLERTRTIASGGLEGVTFDDNTRPSITEVQELIEQATPLVLLELPSSFPTEHYDGVKHCIALYVAVLIEGSYFREQEDSLAVETWRTLYNTALLNMKREIESDLAQWRLLKRIEIPPEEWQMTPLVQPSA